VAAKRRPLACSVIGVMVESIESPHGDQVDRAAAPKATITPSAKTRFMCPSKLARQ
jgi:hypothetical protein